MTKFAPAVLAGALVAVSMLPHGAAAQDDLVRYRDEVFTGVSTTPDLVYGQAVNSRGELEILKLDVHEPAGDLADLRPAVVWVHGGYFKRGDKAEAYYAEYVSALARAGYVVASINYRLRPELPEGAGPTVTELRIDEYVDAVTDVQHDAQAAIRWVRNHAVELRVDPELVAIAGHSAGGITATSVAFNSEDPGDSGIPGDPFPSSRPAAAISHAGGGLPTRTAHIDTGEPPILFVHGLVDDVVPYPAAVMPCVVTVAMQNVCEQVLDPDQDHGLFGAEEARAFLYRWLIDRPELRQPVALTIVGFPSEE